MSALRSETVSSFDGTPLAVHRLGEGRPVLMLHGLFSSAEVNWIKYGTAERVAAQGFECIMPDLRAHGGSGAPHDAPAYPANVLVRDAQAVAEELAFDDYDLVGFSLGARTAVRAVLSGMTPRRLVLGGMGLEGLGNWGNRLDFFIDAIDRFDQIERGDPAYFAKSFMQTMDIDRVAARLLLHSLSGFDGEELAGVTMPTLVVCGKDDQDNGSAPALADALPHGTYAEVPGTHMSSVVQAKFGEAIATFLAA